MQTLRGVPGQNRALRLPMAIAGFMLALSLGACGDDDDSCGYAVTDVPDSASCDAIGAELDCATDAFNDGTDTCTLAGCLCADIDNDFDGDIDLDQDD